MFIQKPFSLTSGAAGEAAYVPAGAIWINGTDEYLHWTPSSTGTPKTQTFSVWTKANVISGDTALFSAWPDDSNHSYMDFNGGGEGIFRTAMNVGNVLQFDLRPTPLYRDTTAWKHWVFVYDITNVTAGDRIRIYQNGVRITAFGTATYPDTSDTPHWATSGTAETIGAVRPSSPVWFADIYLSDFVRLDGYAGLPSDFGTEDSNGLWVPKDPTDIVTANKGTNGFWLDFADSTDLGNDVSFSGLSVGTDNSLTSVNMGTANSTLDRPADDASTNVGNYWTLNPLASTDTPTNGNLSFTGAANFSTYATAPALPMTGKWYYEVKATGGDAPIGTSASYDAYLGLVRTDIAIPTGSHTSNVGLWVIANWNPTPSGQKANGSTATYVPTTGFADNSIIMVAVDLDNNAIWFGNDGTWAGSATSLEIAAGTTTNAAFTSANNSFGSNQMMPYQANYSDLATYNFGATAFAHTPPTGFKALNTANLPEPTVKNGENNFLPMIYEGNGAGQRVGNFIPFTDSHTVDNSCVLDEGDTDYFTRSVWGTSTDTTKWTLSMWVKRGALGKQRLVDAGSNLSNQNIIEFTAADALDFQLYVAPNSGRITSNRLFKQTDTWTHIVIVHDSSNGTANDKMRMYINGSRTTSLGANTPPSSNLSLLTINGQNTSIGYDLINTSDPFDGYMSEVIFVDGYALDASPFGETDTSTNRWIPKTVTAATLNTAGGGSSGFGTNGFYLEFETDSALGTDTSGNTNTFTPTNIAAANQTVDTPTKNCATLSPNNQSAATLSNGNLTMAGQGAVSPYSSALTTMALFDYAYFEVLMVGRSAAAPNDGDRTAAIFVKDTTPIGDVDVNLTSNSNIYGIDNGFIPYSLGSAGTDPSLSWAVGEYGCFAIRGSAGGTNIWVGEDSTSSWVGGGNPVTNSTPTLTIPYPPHEIFVGGQCYLSTDKLSFNCGGQTFSQTPPTGFKALSQNNAPDNTAGITGFSWIKNRAAAVGDYHILQDRVRGIYNYISSNSTNTEDANSNSVQKFLQQGVQIGNMDAVNTSAESFVLWQWAANGTGTLNELGSIDSTVSANTDAGFSIVKYTGTGSAATVGHGLSSAPSFIINKPLASATDNNLQVYHSGMGATQAMWLNQTNAPATSSTYWNNVAPSTTAPFVFSIGTDRDSTVEYINYCWAEVEGYSKFGTYIGNGVADGPYIYLGFKPSWIMFKNASQAGYGWNIYDIARTPYNPTSTVIAANYASGDSTVASYKIDILANGFKIRGNAGETNYSGNTIIYMAFASNPFGGSGVGQARAE